MTIYDIDREAIGNEIEARIQKDGSLGLHFSLISGRKQGNGFRFFRRVWYSAKGVFNLLLKEFYHKTSFLASLFCKFPVFPVAKNRRKCAFLPKSLEFSRVSSENRSQNPRQISRLYIIVIIINLFQETNY